METRSRLCGSRTLSSRRSSELPPPSDPAFEFDAIWEHANDKERRVLVEELIEAVTIHADRLEVTVVGAPPPITVLQRGRVY